MRLANWLLIGAPWDCSGTGRGEKDAPLALRQAGLSTLVGRDLGDAATTIASHHRDEHTGVLALTETLAAAESLARVVSTTLTEFPRRRPLVIGGDCSVLFGVFAALLRSIGPTGLWFVDGHPDYLDGHSSDTGETADLDLAVLTGAGAEPLTGLAGSIPMVAVEDVVLLGHRTADLDAGSAAELARLPVGLRRLDAPTIRKDPIAAGRKAERWLRACPRVWLHVDLDVLDPASLPAVTYPQPGGLNWEQLAATLVPFTGSPHLRGVSIADFRPDLDPTASHARAVVNLINMSLAS